MPETTTTNDDLMTAGEAREILGISRQALARLMKEGTLPATPSPIDRRLKLVRRSDVAKLQRIPRPRPRAKTSPEGRQH